MDRISIAVNTDTGNGKLSASTFLNAFLLEDGERIAEIRAILEGGELHVRIRGKEGKVKFGILGEQK